MWVLLRHPCWRPRRGAQTPAGACADGGASPSSAVEPLLTGEDALLPLLQPPWEGAALPPLPPLPAPAASKPPALPDALDSASPADAAGLLSRVTFSWMSPTLAAGYAAPLEQEGLPALPAEDACAAVGAAFDTAAAARPHRGLAATLWAAHGRTFAAAALFKLTFDALQFTGPVLLNGLITFLAQSQAGCAAGGSGAACPPLGLGLAYAGLLLASSLGQTALLHQYFFRAFRFGQHLVRGGGGGRQW